MIRTKEETNLDIKNVKKIGEDGGRMQVFFYVDEIIQEKLF